MRPRLEVTAGPADRSVAVLATVKSELGIAGTSEDAKLNRLIGAVGAAFSGPNGLQREPWRQTYRESLPGRGGHWLHLSRYPIESLVTLTYDGDTVTGFAVDGPERDKLYREDGWNLDAPPNFSAYPTAGEEELKYVATYLAGWLMPGQIGDWVKATAYTAGQWARASDKSILVRFEATTGGTSHATNEPSWDTTVGATTTDGTVVWTARAAREMPEDLQEAALAQVILWKGGGLLLPAGIKSEFFDGARIEYRDDVVNGTHLAPHVQAVLRAYR